MTQITPMLMFVGDAEEAMNLYVSLFPDAEVLDVDRYGPGEPGAEGRSSARPSVSVRSSFCASTARSRTTSPSRLRSPSLSSAKASSSWTRGSTSSGMTGQS